MTVVCAAIEVNTLAPSPQHLAHIHSPLVATSLTAIAERAVW